jgi:cytochrome P450
MRRCKSDHRWSAGLSERGVFPRRFEVVDVFRTDWPDLPILHPGTASEIHHAHLEPANLVLEKEGGRYVRARSCETSTIDPGKGSEPLQANENDRPNDLMQWLVEQSSRSTNPAEMSPRNLANKLVLFNLFATHTLTTTFTTLITTLLTHHSSVTTLSALRAEASQILPKASKSPTLTKEMNLHDSVLRETLRFHPAFDDSMLREVVAPAGLYTPDGTYLPRGSHVALHTRLMQRSSFAGEGDGCDSFLPFRYCEKVAEGGDKSPETVVADKGQISAVQISGRYMPFGLGKHAW